MPNPYTSDELIAAMRTLGAIPKGSGLSTPEILRVFTDEMGLYIPALLKSIREEYLVVSVDLAVTEATVPIPARACGAALRTLNWLDGEGNPTPLVRIEPERRADYALTSDRPCAYMFQGSSAILVPAVSSGTLRVAYQQRPGRLVTVEACGEVTSIVGLNVTVDEIPSDFTSTATYDLIPGTPNFAALAIDQAATVAGSVLTFASVPAALAVGDFIALAGETPIPQMPQELHTVLAQRVALKLNEGGDSKRLAAIASGLKQAREDAIALLSPRNDGSVRAIRSRSGIGSRRRLW